MLSLMPLSAVKMASNIAVWKVSRSPYPSMPASDARCFRSATAAAFSLPIAASISAATVPIRNLLPALAIDTAQLICAVHHAAKRMLFDFADLIVASQHASDYRPGEAHRCHRSAGHPRCDPRAASLAGAAVGWAARARRRMEPLFHLASLSRGSKAMIAADRLFMSGRPAWSGRRTASPGARIALTIRKSFPAAMSSACAPDRDGARLLSDARRSYSFAAAIRPAGTTAEVCGSWIT